MGGGFQTFRRDESGFHPRDSKHNGYLFCLKCNYRVMFRVCKYYEYKEILPPIANSLPFRAGVEI